MNILIALLVLSLLILIHELGHFTAAKLNGIRVLEFSMFMGPKLFSFKKGETQYTLRLIPMGGFVKMEGEETASDDPRAFSAQKIWKRVAVIAAGPIMNIVLAFVLMTIYMMNTNVMTNQVSEFGPNSSLKAAGLEVGDTLTSWNGRKIHDFRTDMTMFLYGADNKPIDIKWEKPDGSKHEAVMNLYKTPPIYRLGFSVISDGDEATNVVDLVEPNTPLEAAGGKSGDVIVKIDDQVVANRDDIVNYLNYGRGEENPPISVTVLRNGEERTFTDVTPFADSYFTIDTDFKVEEVGFGGAIVSSTKYSNSTIRMVFTTVGWLFTGHATLKDLSGPVGIVGTIGTVVAREHTIADKLLSLASLGALLSLNLGVMNLIPFPALDGSKLVLLLIEKVRKKPLAPEKEGIISLVGFSLLILLLLATLVNDIPRWIL